MTKWGVRAMVNNATSPGAKCQKQSSDRFIPVRCRFLTEGGDNFDLGCHTFTLHVHLIVCGRVPVDISFLGCKVTGTKADELGGDFHHVKVIQIYGVGVFGKDASERG